MSILSPSHYEQRCIRTISFNNSLLSMSIRTRLHLYQYWIPLAWSASHKNYLVQQYFIIKVNPDTTLSVSISNPSSYDWRGMRTIQFNNNSLSMSIQTQLYLYQYSIYIFLSRKWFRRLLVRKPRSNYSHTVIKVESNSNWMYFGFYVTS